jgi:hypothetical protein
VGGPALRMAAMTGCSVVGIDLQVIAQCGLRLLSTENLTRNMAEVGERRRIARESRSSSLREIEGDQTLRATARFLGTAALIAKEEPRFLYVCEKLT